MVFVGGRFGYRRIPGKIRLIQNTHPQKTVRMAFASSLCRPCTRQSVTPVAVQNSIRLYLYNRSYSTSIPQDILDQLDHTKPLANSVNLYSRHFSVSTGEYNWPSTMREDLQYGPDSTNPFRLSQFVVDWATAMKSNRKVVCTKSSHQSLLPCVHVYPDNVKITFNSSTLKDVEKFQSVWMFGSDEKLDFITVEPLAKNTVHIYVCCHRARDERCGIIGELLISKIREYVNAPPAEMGMNGLDIQVFGCSHVGGHKFAGNMVVYKPDWKQGIWYGRALPDDIDKIMRETVIDGKILAKHWRGGLPDGNWDPKEHITGEEAEKRAIECACML